jgi:hypothetical protein
LRGQFNARRDRYSTAEEQVTVDRGPQKAHTWSRMRAWVKFLLWEGRGARNVSCIQVKLQDKIIAKTILKILPEI